MKRTLALTRPTPIVIANYRCKLAEHKSDFMARQSHISEILIAFENYSILLKESHETNVERVRTRNINKTVIIPGSFSSWKYQFNDVWIVNITYGFSYSILSLFFSTLYRRIDSAFEKTVNHFDLSLQLQYLKLVHSLLIHILSSGPDTLSSRFQRTISNKRSPQKRIPSCLY